MSYNKVIIQGGMPGGEVWSCGLSFDADGGEGIQDPEDLVAWATAIGAIINSWSLTQTMRQLMGNVVTVTQVRCEARAEDESLINFGEFAFPTPLVGGSTPTKPFQTSLVLSLRTATPGGTGRGRVYWPTLSLVLNNTTLRVDSGTRTGYVTDWRTFINAVIAAVSPGVVLHLIVRSVTYHVSRRVNLIQVGDVADVQRRRRDELVEAYTALPFPA